MDNSATLWQPHSFMESKRDSERRAHDFRNMGALTTTYFFFLFYKHKNSTLIIQRYLSHHQHFCSLFEFCNVTPLAKIIHLPLNDVLNLIIIPCSVMHRLYYGRRRQTEKLSLMYKMALEVVQIWFCLEMWLNIQAI